MESRPSLRRSSSLRAAVVAGSQLWTATQVELHGDYPVHHILAFEQYAARTSTTRALLVCLLTPLPAVLLVLAIDWLPLEAPATNDASHSLRVWIRLFFTACVGSACVLEQFRQHVPSLQLQRWPTPFISIAGGLTASGCAFLLAHRVAYPFPFTMNVVTTPWFTVVLSLMLLSARRQLARDAGVKQDMLRHQVVCLCQILLTVIYPLYNAVFTTLTPWQQTAFVLVLPLIKLAAKNWISRSLVTADDARPESVVFNVEVFHALFVSFSMQSSTAPHTVLALMAVDVAQAWLAVADVNAILRRLEPLETKRPGTMRDLVHLACRVVEAEPFQGRHHQPVKMKKTVDSVAVAPLPKQSSVKADEERDAGVSTARVHPEPERSLLPESLRLLSEAERGQLVVHTQKLLFTVEFTALVEYTEVIVPLIFNMYILIMFHLPNRQYYGFLRGLTREQLGTQLANVFLYSSLELASLLLLSILLWRKLRLSLLHQIAFVLETRQASIQSKVLIWVTVVMQNAVDQLGVDYTFKFAWLQRSS